MKDNLDYYRRDVDAYTTGQIRVLRNRFGFDGECKYYLLKDHIAKASKCWLNVQNRHISTELRGDLAFSQEELTTFIDYLKGEECGLLIEDEANCISTEDLQELFKKIYAERKRAVINRKVERPDEIHNPSTPMPTAPQAPNAKKKEWAEKTAAALENNKKNPDRTREKFIKHCIALEHCGKDYAEKTWDQAMQIQKEYKEKIWNKITVFILFAESGNSQHLTLYREIAQYVNDFNPRNKRRDGPAQIEGEDF